MRLAEQFRKINWEEGSAELLSFCIMAPFVMICIYLFLNISMIINASQQAEYAAYIGGRTAVISVDSGVGIAGRLAAAKGNADAVVENTMRAYSYSDSLTPYTWKSELKLDGGNTVWAKGEYATYTITLCVPSFYGDSNSGIVSSSVTMMIESPTTQGTTIK